MKSSQAKNTQLPKEKQKRHPKTVIDPAFGDRLRALYPDLRFKKQIAEKLGLGSSALTDYFKGQIPSYPVLKKISLQTGASIHWLLTGEGPERIGIQIEPPLESDKLRDFIIDTLRLVVLRLYRRLGESDRQAVHRFMLEQFTKFNEESDSASE